MKGPVRVPPCLDPDPTAPVSRTRRPESPASQARSAPPSPLPASRDPRDAPCAAESPRGTARPGPAVVVRSRHHGRHPACPRPRGVGARRPRGAHGTARPASPEHPGSSCRSSLPPWGLETWGVASVSRPGVMRRRCFVSKSTPSSRTSWPDAGRVTVPGPPRAVFTFMLSPEATTVHPHPARTGPRAPGRAREGTPVGVRPRSTRQGGSGRLVFLRTAVRSCPGSRRGALLAGGDLYCPRSRGLIGSTPFSRRYTPTVCPWSGRGCVRA